MALVPRKFLDCVVAIGTKQKTAGADGKLVETTFWGATGFLFGHRVKKDNREEGYRIFLVTNRHVVEDEIAIQLRFNPQDGKDAREYPIDLELARQRGVIKVHPDVDLAIITIDHNQLNNDKIQYSFFRSDTAAQSKQDFINNGFSEGDSVFVLGFPMGHVGKNRNYVIVRQGIIARIGEYLKGESNEILLDCSIFPGNSGGPVITKPESIAIEGTKSFAFASLIGVIASYIPYHDIAISPQTKRTRIVFEENSGLASMIPIQYLLDFAAKAEKSFSQINSGPARHGE
jgi:S1-C subfamily serine protease